MPDGPCIFYAEDDDDDFDLMEELCTERCSLPLVRATSGQRALEDLQLLADEGKADTVILLLVDHNMPLLSGEGLIRALRAMPAYRLHPIVLLSTSRSLREPAAVSHLDVQFIPKATGYDELQTNVEAILCSHCAPYLLPTR